MWVRKIKECFVEWLRFQASCFKKWGGGNLEQAEIVSPLSWVEMGGAKASSAGHRAPSFRS